jgi:F0F1-type ATP synthase membrane subunit c/vacuolar-type H+-ATPase subunit K
VFLAELGRIAGGKAARTVGDDVERPERNGVLVTDVLFVLVMLAVFGLLALVTRGAEKL